ncbi:MAG: hypothetical protein ACRC5M_00825, partial [Anaeroplasmataceae bacterium]
MHELPLAGKVTFQHMHACDFFETLALSYCDRSFNVMSFYTFFSDAESDRSFNVMSFYTFL